jgi:hypothetical protein
MILTRQNTMAKKKIAKKKDYVRKIVKNDSGQYLVMVSEDLVDAWSIEKVFYKEIFAISYIRRAED